MNKLKEMFGDGWYNLLEPILTSNYFKRVGREVNPDKFSSKIIYPAKDDIFKAFRLTSPSTVKVVILGQDPYHDGSATGLAFSNRSLLKISPSLKNILKEVENDIYDGLRLEQDPDLTRWADQGVLLLNTALTVEKGKPGCHAHIWDKFTRYVLSTLSQTEAGVIYMLWGGHAKGFRDCIVEEANFILTATHPSPLSANRGGWFGCKHFSKTNEILKEVGIAIGVDNYEIEW